MRDPRQFIQQCRLNWAQAIQSKSLFGKAKIDVAKCLRAAGLTRKTSNLLADIAGNGKVIWGAFVIANTGLLSPGKRDLPAGVLMSLDPYFDTHPLHLSKIAERAHTLRQIRSDRPEIENAARAILDDSFHESDQRLPWVLTDEHEVFFVSTVIQRAMLQGKPVTEKLMPFVINPDHHLANFLLPSIYWPHDVANLRFTTQNVDGKALGWRRHARSQAELDEDRRVALDRPYRPVTEMPKAQRFPAGHIAMTRAAELAVKNIVIEQQIPSPWYLRFGGPEDDSKLDITHAFDPELDRSIESHGVTIIVRKKYKFRTAFEVDTAAEPTLGGFSVNPA